MKRIVLSLVVAFVMVLATTDAYSQCAMCRATVESNVGTGSPEPESEVGSGLNTGILYLMAIPYLLVGTVGFLWYKSNKRKNG
ncbi:hypothetical protein [Pontibacter harenae]|uniref:hypothetical protein n=1 Tax=Pontibacter harenae TaxID=2894083 RepID=UPI001E3F27EB|nr:hypothetical protein [Pontibacter harenae]MCC9166132.1 hypothetical protein [Pontibacter harenae]